MKDNAKKWLEENGYVDVSDDEFVTFRSPKTEIGIWINRDGKWCAQLLRGNHVFNANGYATPRNAFNAVVRFVKEQENAQA